MRRSKLLLPVALLLLQPYNHGIFAEELVKQQQEDQKGIEVKISTSVDQQSEGNNVSRKKLEGLLSRLEIESTSALEAKNVSHFLALGSVQDKLEKYNHASFSYSKVVSFCNDGADTVVESARRGITHDSTTDADACAEAVARLGKLNNIRTYNSTLYVRFSHPDPDKQQEAVALAIPFYICLDKGIPFFYYGMDCSNMVPNAIVVGVDNTEVSLASWSWSWLRSCLLLPFIPILGLVPLCLR